jgi:hypothetical protein
MLETRREPSAGKPVLRVRPGTVGSAMARHRSLAIDAPSAPAGPGPAPKRRSNRPGTDHDDRSNEGDRPGVELGPGVARTRLSPRTVARQQHGATGSGYLDPCGWQTTICDLRPNLRRSVRVSTHDLSGLGLTHWGEPSYLLGLRSGRRYDFGPRPRVHVTRARNYKQYCAHVPDDEPCGRWSLRHSRC